ncbi:hypothetical protein K474DRAFT_1676504 [Panus rudis PR-1116 ss-1]|nr:hypothetical protein K474DRAFT_1676504 [Panus rudis PR-1116 ss-1]
MITDGRREETSATEQGPVKSAVCIGLSIATLPHLQFVFKVGGYLDTVGFKGMNVMSRSLIDNVHRTKLGVVVLVGAIAFALMGIEEVADEIQVMFYCGDPEEEISCVTGHSQQIIHAALEDGMLYRRSLLWHIVFCSILSSTHSTLLYNVIAIARTHYSFAVQSLHINGSPLTGHPPVLVITSTSSTVTLANSQYFVVVGTNSDSRQIGVQTSANEYFTWKRQLRMCYRRIAVNNCGKHRTKTEFCHRHGYTIKTYRISGAKFRVRKACNRVTESRRMTGLWCTRNCSMIASHYGSPTH